jgi:hypothetical protein
MKPRRYVITLELTTDDSATATKARQQLKRVAGQAPENLGLKVSTYTVDGPSMTQPVVLMERKLP